MKSTVAITATDFTLPRKSDDLAVLVDCFQVTRIHRRKRGHVLFANDSVMITI